VQVLFGLLARSPQPSDDIAVWVMRRGDQPGQSFAQIGTPLNLKSIRTAVAVLKSHRRL